VRNEQFFAQLVVQFVESAVQYAGVFVRIEYMSNQREPISVKSAGRDSDEYVSYLDILGF
jgi:hypothetical protein